MHRAIKPIKFKIEVAVANLNKQETVQIGM